MREREKVARGALEVHESDLEMASSSIPSSVSTVTNNKGSINDVITINEKVNLTKQQHQVLKIICDTFVMEETQLSYSMMYPYLGHLLLVGCEKID
jgi:hypothetical protein